MPPEAEPAEEIQTEVAAPVEPSAEPAPVEAVQESSWRDGIEEGPLLDQANRYTTAQAAIQGNLDMRKKMSTAVNIPGENATDEDRAEFNEKMGVPKSVDDYKINLPDGLDELLASDEASQAAMKNSLAGLHKAGASQAVVDEAVAAHFTAVQKIETDKIEADKEYSKQSMAILEKEWGSDTDENKAIAGKAAEKLFGANFEEMRQIETKDGNFIMDHPGMLRMLASIGREMGDSTLGGVVSDEQRGSIMEKANDIRNKREEALRSGNNVLANQLDEQERQLLAKIA